MIRNTSPVATSPFEAGSKAMQQLLDLPQPPTAVFCHSDVMALGALSQAKRQGLKTGRPFHNRF
ncbi:substrate-binding domain-containing protein [Escherichia coli]